LPTDVNELAELVRSLSIESAARVGRKLDVPAPAHGPERAGDLRSNLVTNAKAHELLGWQPTVLVRDGLRETVEWFAKQ
jgi:nucleoside-diphosphate-sugar epimerase